MATLVLSAAGAALGGSIGGSLAGVSAMALGKAAGAIIGNSIDQTILGQGAATVETGHVDQFRIMGASEGAVIPRVFGRMRVAGQLIWSSRFLEAVNEESVGGKGGGGTLREYSYSISIALALCEGEILRIGRIWADGQPLDQTDVTLRVYRGTEDQLPDPTIAAIEGLDATPAYRGLAYVVFENLQLTQFGNRIPQFNFEVFRRSSVSQDPPTRSPALDVKGVALVPGTGEYALATEQVMFVRNKGIFDVANVHNDRGIPDILASLDQLKAELPNAKATSLVVSWFGSDLRCDHCEIFPAVEQKLEDGEPMPWQVAGLSRASARMVGRVDDRPVFGGTPADESVTQAIRHIRTAGQRVMFYPFILMDILAENGLRDPWTGNPQQPAIPWRGRITLSEAPGCPGSPDQSARAADEVQKFFGAATADEFVFDGERPVYRGSDGWSYRRFVLHYAHLCAAAGGVDAFCIGSELRSLTQIRDGEASFPAVRALRRLATDVRAILGKATKIGYAADWSEYFGHQVGDGSGDVLFHLDPLWSHDDIDFIGIDNYMPLSDWRDGGQHADADYGSIYNLDYLGGNVAGGEGYDWYYADERGRETQERLPIKDTAYAEHWVFRYKDLVNWWSNPHFNRIGGARSEAPTSWMPRSKPIWFTELGCPAVDKGTNQPNVFHDPKSSESMLPYFSSGVQDEFIQRRYLQATFRHWGDKTNNPISDLYGGPMVDMDNAYVWAWDARPWPDFPARMDTWIDGGNYHLGHWLNGRAALCSLAEVVAETCQRSGLSAADIDVDELNGTVTGIAITSIETARQSLQPLMLTHAFDSFTGNGRLVFTSRGEARSREICADDCVVTGSDPVLLKTRAPRSETPSRVTFGFVRDDSDYAAGATEAVADGQGGSRVSQTNCSIVLGEGMAKSIAERWLSESLVAMDTLNLALPPSSLDLVPGDTLALRGESSLDLYRIDRVDEMGHRIINATRVEPRLYDIAVNQIDRRELRALNAATPVHAELLDLPILRGDEAAHAPYVAVAKKPWAGTVAVYSSASDYDYSLKLDMSRPAVMGQTVDPVPAGPCGRWFHGAFRVLLASGVLQSREYKDVLNGANAAALRNGPTGDWEVIQFGNAELGPDGCFRLSSLLRGQAGTDFLATTPWPAGTDFILLDNAVQQIDMPRSAVGLERHYRIGPARKSYDSKVFLQMRFTAEGVGWRPYRPVHLGAELVEGGAIALSWVRRTRIDGDSWQGADVPLGEGAEIYHVRILSSGKLVREYFTARSQVIYTGQDQTKDGTHDDFSVEIAQISERFGPGPYASLTIKRADL